MKIKEKIKSNPKLAIFTTLLVVLLIILTTSHSIFAYNSKINQISLISDYGTKNSYIATIKIHTKNFYEINPSSVSSTIEESDEPTNTSDAYNTYNTISSYMEKFETNGEGTLILQKGTYIIDMQIYIPSNVNIILEDGAIIKKVEYEGSEDLDDSNHLFELIEPSNAKTSGAYEEYNGVHNVNIIGRGESIIDLGYIESEIAIARAHNKNINIQGIIFKNLNSGHFIELDASNNVTITKSSFLDSKSSPKLNKEAINIDTPDKSIKGFGCIWSSFDKTPNKNVLIKNNTFNNLDRAIGTHKYSQGTYNSQYIENKSQQYHENIVLKIIK